MSSAGERTRRDRCHPAESVSSQETTTNLLYAARSTTIMMLKTGTSLFVDVSPVDEVSKINDEEDGRKT